MAPPKIKSASALEDLTLKVEFRNGVVKLFNLKNVVDRPNYQLLKNFTFFKNLKVSSDGYSIYWNDEIDICENEIWQKGTIIS